MTLSKIEINEHLVKDPFFSIKWAIGGPAMLGGTDLGPAAKAVTLPAKNDTMEHLDSHMPLLSDLQMFQNEKFYLNLTQVLNISAENLTNLLLSVQQQEEHGTQTSPVATQTPMVLLTILSICYALIFIAGVLGNLITCIVISRNNFMHTATNFYLFNLAISDLILLCSGMPQDLYNLWQPDNYPFSDGICIMESILSETAANATVLTITAFTVERYIAICHPFRQHTMSKLSRAIKFIFAIWIAALLLALPQAMQFSVVSLETKAGAYYGSSCTMQNNFYAHVFAVSGFLFFGGPMTAICVLYVLIGVKLKRSRLLQSLQRRPYDIHRGISAQTRVIRMLVAVAVAFFICWAPFHAQRLMAVYGSSSGIKSELFTDIFNILNYTSGVLYFLSTCINPLLYNIMSHKFREAFKVTLSRHFRLSSKYQSQSQPHNYSVLRRNQHGSLRLNTTDSIRTTTTMTTVTMNGNSVGQPGSARCSQRLHRISLDGSHATLLSTQSKQDLFAGRAGAELAHSFSHPHSHGPPHRLLQTQISQLSSVGDAHSLLEAEIDGTQLSQPTMCAIDELSSNQPGISRSRLKLTRVTRPSRAEPQHCSGIGGGSGGGVAISEPSGKVRKAKAKTLKTSSTLKSLRTKFNWRTRRKASRPAQSPTSAEPKSPTVGAGPDERSVF
ncbi:neuropeptides capa receptor [Scaptodrosophila lebanonensis]|uniref:Neuropeptides capa receptor n=1 Tax=Drosophila lebanonensis TaxID=7225 RepID=A0A6J2T5H6_DROLE|nr:neuropeptides capa receptor [Scaptodrosophila lebanonensis]